MIRPIWDITLSTITQISLPEEIHSFTDYIITANKLDEFLTLFNSVEDHYNTYNSLCHSTQQLLDAIGNRVERGATHIPYSYDVADNIFTARQAMYDRTTEKLTRYLNKITPIRIEAGHIYNQLYDLKLLIEEKNTALNIIIEADIESSHNVVEVPEIEKVPEIENNSQSDSNSDHA